MQVDFAAGEQPLGGLMHLVEGGGKALGRHVLARDPDALHRLDEVRRCVEAGAHSGSTQAGLDHSRNRALTVCSGYMHPRAARVRIAERAQQRTDALETQLRRLYFIAE